MGCRISGIALSSRFSEVMDCAVPAQPAVMIADSAFQ